MAAPTHSQFSVFPLPTFISKRTINSQTILNENSLPLQHSSEPSFPRSNMTPLIEMSSTGCHFTQKRCLCSALPRQLAEPLRIDPTSAFQKGGDDAPEIRARLPHQFEEGIVFHFDERPLPLDPRRRDTAAQAGSALAQRDSPPLPHSPFFLSSGLPFLTVAITMSPTPAAGSLFRRPLMPFTEMMYRFLAPAERSVALPGMLRQPPPTSNHRLKRTVQAAASPSSEVLLSPSLTSH